MNKDFVASLLNDIEKDAVATFVTNHTMLNAVRKVLLAGLYHNGTLSGGTEADPSRNFALSMAFNNPDATNEALGADLRANAKAIILLQVALAQLEKFKPEVVSEEKQVNKAR